jgi:hypothetical protein
VSNDNNNARPALPFLLDSLDTSDFQDWVIFPGHFRAGHSAHHHALIDLARFAVRRIKTKTYPVLVAFPSLWLA